MFAGVNVSGLRKGHPMSKLSTQQMDLQIQLSLVAKIREAARRYRTEPAESDPTALQSYIAALELLAEHIELKCRGALISEASALRTQRLRKHALSETAKHKAGERVIPFPGSGAPLTAA
jgi:hypothetical protein